MFSRREERSGAGFWILAAGLAAGVSAVVWLALQRRRRPSAELQQPLNQFFELEDTVIEALRADALLRGRAIDVAAIASGIIELSGTVETEEEAHHAVEVVQGVNGVRTVLNRLDLGEFENRLRSGRGESAAGGSSRWYGMGVGMGRRRQSASTDPARRDDHADLLDEAITADPEEMTADLNEEAPTAG